METETGKFICSVVDHHVWQRNALKLRSNEERRRYLIDALQALDGRSCKEMMVIVVDDLISKFGIAKAEFSIHEDLIGACGVNNCWEIFAWWVGLLDGEEFQIPLESELVPEK